MCASTAGLQPGVTRQQADATLSVVARRLAVAYPRSEKDAEVTNIPLYAGRLGDWILSHNLACGFFLGLAGLVLLLACVNVANLLAGPRPAARERGDGDSLCAGRTTIPPDSPDDDRKHPAGAIRRSGGHWAGHVGYSHC